MKRIFILCGVLALMLLAGCSVKKNGHWEWGIRSDNAATQAGHFALSVQPYDFDAEADGYRSLLLMITNTSDNAFVIDRSQCFFTQEGRLYGLLLFEDESPLGTFDELPPVTLYPGETLAKAVHPEKFIVDGRPGLLPLGTIGAFVTVRRGVHSETAEASLTFEKYWVED